MAKDIGYDSEILSGYNFETKLGELHSSDMSLAITRARRSGQRGTQIPNQSIRTL